MQITITLKANENLVCDDHEEDAENMVGGN